MMFDLHRPLVWILYIVVPVLSIAVSNTTFQPECHKRCQYEFKGADRYNWVEQSITRTETQTATVVTVVDTLLGNTILVTTYNARPPMTVIGDEGTREQTLKYDRSSRTYTTTITYPQAFTRWPDSYTWHGTLSLTDPSNGARCATASSSMVAILSEPQELQQSIDKSDPRGLRYAFEPVRHGRVMVDKHMFPDQQPVQDCLSMPADPGHGWGVNWGWTVTDWTTMHITTSELGPMGASAARPIFETYNPSQVPSPKTTVNIGGNTSPASYGATPSFPSPTGVQQTPTDSQGKPGLGNGGEQLSYSNTDLSEPSEDKSCLPKAVSRLCSSVINNGSDIPAPTSEHEIMPNILITESHIITLLPDIPNTGGITIPRDPLTTTLPSGHIAVGHDGQDGESLVVIDHSNTITVPTAISEPVTFTTLGETITFPPLPSAGGGKPQDPPATMRLPNDHTAVGSKGPNGESVVILDGSHTITAPTGLSTPATLTTMGVTLTFSPPSVAKGEPKTNQPSAYTLPNGHVAGYRKDSKGDLVLVIDGAQTVRIPTAATPVTITTMGETLTFSPLSAPSGVTASVTAITMVLITHANQTTEGASRTSTGPHTSLVSQSKAGKTDTVEAGATTGIAATASGKSGGARPEANYPSAEAMIVLLILMVYQMLSISI